MGWAPKWAPARRSRRAPSLRFLRFQEIKNVSTPCDNAAGLLEKR